MNHVTTFLHTTALCLVALTSFAADIPVGYKLAYEQKFDSVAALHDFRFTDPAAWRFSKQER